MMRKVTLEEIGRFAGIEGMEALEGNIQVSYPDTEDRDLVTRILGELSKGMEDADSPESVLRCARGALKLLENGLDSWILDRGFVDVCPFLSYSTGVQCCKEYRKRHPLYHHS